MPPPASPRRAGVRRLAPARSGGRLLPLVLAVALLVLGSGCAVPADPVPRAVLAPDAPVTARVSGWLSVDASLRNATGVVDWVWQAPMRACRLMLQLPPNTPVSAANGSRVFVDEVDVAGRRVPTRLLRPVPGDRGSVAVVTLPACVDAGSTLRFSVRFRAFAGAGGVERFGYHDGVSWWGSLLPAPAYANVHGWVLTRPVRTKGESELANVFTVHDLRVFTPAGVQLAGPGTVAQHGTVGGRATWRVDTGLVRDLVLVTGRLRAAFAGAAGCRVRAVVPAGDRESHAATLAQAGARALAVLRDHFGFCPYATTTVAAVAGTFGGMEFPGLVVVADRDPDRYPRLVPHELGHQYFYAFVGSNQAQHPWLDEGFATYAEALVNPDTAATLLATRYPARLRGRLGAPMRYWDQHPGDYSSGVYGQAASALLRARAVVGGRRMDAAVRDWLAVCGQRVCGPQRLRLLLRADAPAAGRVLGAAGAWRSFPDTALSYPAPAADTGDGRGR